MNLKDEFNKAFAEDLATKFSAKAFSFDSKGFVNAIINKHWEEKELKERMRHITHTINDFVNEPYPKQIEIISPVAIQYGGMKGMIFPDFIQVYGLDHFDKSIAAMALFTQYSTSEFAIRPFIEKYPEKAMAQMNIWSQHKNEHLRRLASEGSRPKLPWAPPLRNFIKDPTPSLNILENLKNDESLYVRKSVANHLNDISKSQPELVLKIANQWFGVTKNTDWIVKHALRTLLKKGDKRALAIFGLDNSKGINTIELSIAADQLKIGEFTHFNFEVENTSNTERNIRLEYKIAYIKANKSQSEKVFQISEFSLKPKSRKHFKRKQWFKQLSTRKHYAGIHLITLIVNGDCKNSIEVNLID